MIDRSITIKNVSDSTNTINVITSLSQTIDDSSSYQISIGRQSLTLTSDNSNWIIL